MKGAWPSRARRAVFAQGLALSMATAAAMSALAPFPAAATTVKHLEHWTLRFPRGSAELQPRHRRDLVLVATAIERSCLQGPMGGILLAIETVEPRRGLDAAARNTAQQRRRNVQSTLERLAPPGTLTVEGTMPNQEWQSRADTAGVPMVRPTGNDVLLELGCNPLP